MDNFSYLFNNVTIKHLLFSQFVEMHSDPGYAEGFNAGCKFAVEASDGAEA
jgi:hypothetical protein